MDATRYLPFAGRLLIGLPFVASGLSKPAAYSPTNDLIRSSDPPLPPPPACAGAVMVEFRCGPIVAGFGHALSPWFGRCSAWLRQCSFITTLPIQIGRSTLLKTGP